MNKTMNTILKLEEAAMFAAAYWASLYLDYSWWAFFAWLLVPDVSMLGYVVSTKAGALLYNLAHHKGVATTCFLVGLLTSSADWMFAGLLLFGHSSMDRVFGYGLKYPDDFKHTHLGWIGRK